ncbi:hypothetical protein EDD86DRAFT_211500 [Gorgonomyces haynaldii]|nr:hypothetical protein EDD86DRAFT_211500 [Gorgonomyces haynaldii]
MPTLERQDTLGDSFDISRSFETLAIEPVKETVYADDQDTRAKLMDLFSKMNQDASFRPNIPFPVIQMSSSFEFGIDAVIASSAHHAVGMMDRNMMKRVGVSHLMRYVSRLFQRMEDRSVFEAGYQVILLPVLLQHNPKIVRFWRHLIRAFFETNGNALAAIGLDPQSLAKINIFWCAVIADVAISSYLEIIPLFTNLRSNMQFPVPMTAFSQDFQHARYHYGHSNCPGSDYVFTPPDLDVRGIYCVLLLIQTKVIHLKRDRIDQPHQNVHLREQALVYSILDWREQFLLKYPSNKNIMTLIWAYMTDAKAWSLFLELYLPKLKTIGNPRSRSQELIVQTSRQASQSIHNLFKTLVFEHGVVFTKLPGFSIVSLVFCGTVFGLLIKQGEALQSELGFVLGLLQGLTQHMTQAKILLQILQKQISGLGLDISIQTAQPETIRFQVSIH